MLQAVEPINAEKSQGHFANLQTLLFDEMLQPPSALSFGQVPFDLPSAISKLKSGVCRICGLYHVSAAGLKRHMVVCHSNEDKKEDEFYLEEDEDSEFEEDNGSLRRTDLEQRYSLVRFFSMFVVFKEEKCISTKFPILNFLFVLKSTSILVTISVSHVCTPKT